MRPDLPRSISFAHATTSSALNVPHLAEEEALAEGLGNPQRQAQFMLGRRVARMALHRLGFMDPIPILRGKDREPLWPQGVVGSITHTRSDAAAIVSWNSEYASLGIDLEYRDRLFDPGLVTRLCSASEIEWIESDPACARDRTLLLFVAKESVYKAFYPLARKFIGFHDVSFSPHSHECTLVGTLNVGINYRYHRGATFTTMYSLTDLHVFACTLVPA